MYSCTTFFDSSSRKRLYARINPNSVILSNKGKFVMGKYSVASIGLSVVPDMHTSTVGIPQCCLGASHIHDKIEDVIVDEDVWIGMNVTLLGGSSSSQRMYSWGKYTIE